MLYFITVDEMVYYYNYKRMYMSLSIDERLAVTLPIVYEENGGNLKC